MPHKQLIPNKKQKLVYIRWQDAHSNSSWQTEEEITDAINCQKYIIESIGWVIYEDADEIHLVSKRGLWNQYDSNQYGSYVRIPKAWILKKEIQMPHKDKPKREKKTPKKKKRK